MPTYTTFPESVPGPSYPIDKQAAPRIKRVQFGDGYTQEAPDGLNYKQYVWNLNWDALTPSELATIEGFLEARSGYEIFYWYDPSSDVYEVKCKEWTVSAFAPGVFKISATFNGKRSSVVDTTPNAFTFGDITDAVLSTVYTSNTITVIGISSASPISISGGTYSKNGGSYTSSSGTVMSGDTITVRGTSSSSNSTPVNVVLTIGGVSDTFTITTVSSGPDTAPDAFFFTDVTGAALSTLFTSDTITVAGISAPATLTISGGFYSVNGGTYSASTTSVVNGDTVTLRVTSSASYSTSTDVILTIGGVSDTYTVTTISDPASSAGILDFHTATNSGLIVTVL